MSGWAHDHDFALSSVLSSLGKDRSAFPSRWSGTFDQLARQLNVSDDEMHAAFGCDECERNHRAGFADRFTVG